MTESVRLLVEYDATQRDFWQALLKQKTERKELTQDAILREYQSANNAAFLTSGFLFKRIFGVPPSTLPNTHIRAFHHRG